MGPRLLVIGASGQLGRALCAEFRPRAEVIEAAHRLAQAGQWRIDLADRPQVLKALKQIRPDWVLIAGAYCNVDGAERASGLCMAVNRDGPRAVAEYAQAASCGVVHYSTDSIFDGSQESYTELDPACPLNVYSESKVQGEAAVRDAVPDRHLIIRTAWLYGPDEARRNFVFRLLGALKDGQPVSVPSDQWGTPTYAADVARATAELLEGGHRGTFHAAGPELIDRVSFARKICAQFGIDDALLVPTPTDRLGQVARRPLRTRLDCAKLQAEGISPFRGVDDGLKALRNALMACSDV